MKFLLSLFDVLIMNYFSLSSLLLGMSMKAKRTNMHHKKVKCSQI